MPPQALRSFASVAQELSFLEVPVTTSPVLEFPALQSKTAAVEASVRPDLPADALSDALADDGSPLIGLGFAIAIEAGTAFCVYGVWRLWHVFR
jgi:hypothetical protein